MFKEELIADLARLHNISVVDVKLMINQYESFILKCMTENPDKIVHVTNLGKFVVKLGRKKHWERHTEKTGITVEQARLNRIEKKKKRDADRNTTQE